MTPELEVLKTVATRLESAEVSYMVTGSMALNLYATPRMTRDIDLVVELAPDQADTLFNLFSSDFYADRNVMQEEIRRRGMFNIIHYASIVKVDFIIRKSGAYREEEFRRRRRVTMEDVTLFVVAPEDLIISKLFWARDSRSEMQLGDVRNLMDSVDELDREYMDHWAKLLGVEDLYREVSE